jgi:hypothetical protein
MEGGHLQLVEKEIQHLDKLNSKEMNGQNCTYNVIYKQAPQKKKKQAIFTVLGHVVEAQRLPKSCQLHLQNWRSFFCWLQQSH